MQAMTVGSYAPAAPPTAGIAMRIAMGLIGAIALVAASVFTAGGAFAGAVGILIAFAIAKRRGRRLTRWGSWFGAVGTVAVALLVAMTVVFARLPAGSVDRFQRSMDSVSAAQKQQPPPAWLERIAPGSTAASRARRSALPPGAHDAIRVWSELRGGAIVGAVLSVLFGTVGWMPGLLLALAFSGRWIGSRYSPAPAG